MTLEHDERYPIQFADGTATVYITDLFEHRYTDYATAADLLVFCLLCGNYGCTDSAQGARYQKRWKANCGF